MLFPTYFAPPPVDMSQQPAMEIKNLDYQIERCPTCKPMMLLKNGNVRDLDQKTFNRLLKRWRHLYAHQGTVM
jgi:hypothetical protein